MSPGAASHGHPFVIYLSRSLRLCLSSAPLLATLSLFLSLPPIPFPPPPPPAAAAAAAAKQRVGYIHQTPRLSHPMPTTIARSFRRIAKIRTLSSRFPVTFVAYVHTKTLRFSVTRRHLAFLPDLGLRFSPACLRVSSRRISLAHGILYLSLPLSAASQTRSFLASAESPPTGVTTIDYRRVWGWLGNCARGRTSVAVRCCARVASRDGWHHRDSWLSRR